MPRGLLTGVPGVTVWLTYHVQGPGPPPPHPCPLRLPLPCSVCSCTPTAASAVTKPWMLTCCFHCRAHAWSPFPCHQQTLKATGLCPGRVGPVPKERHSLEACRLPVGPDSKLANLSCPPTPSHLRLWRSSRANSVWTWLGSAHREAPAPARSGASQPSLQIHTSPCERAESWSLTSPRTAGHRCFNTNELSLFRFTL